MRDWAETATRAARVTETEVRVEAHFAVRVEIVSPVVLELHRVLGLEQVVVQPQLDRQGLLCRNNNVEN